MLYEEEYISESWHQAGKGTIFRLSQVLLVGIEITSKTTAHWAADFRRFDLDYIEAALRRHPVRAAACEFQLAGYAQAPEQHWQKTKMLLH